MKRLDPLALPLSGATLLEASAGSGKTHTITTLYVRLLLETAVQPGEILVVTYTNAATAELRARVRRRLVQALAALEAGASDDAELDAMIRARVASRAADRPRLTAALYGFDEAAIFTIHGFCQRVLQQHAFESGTAFDLELIGDQTALRDEVVSDFWVQALCAASEEVVREVAESKLDPMKLASLIQRVVAQPDLTVLPLPGADDPVKLRTQLAAIAFALRELPRRKAAAGVQSFDDLLLQVDTALAGLGGEPLAAQIRRRFPVALIDEFQDTDPVQYRIFERIYRDRADAALFLIGDPKQAIYAFRGADVFIYLNAKRAAREQTYTMDVNRRSSPRMVQAVNTLFGRVDDPFVLPDIPFVQMQPGTRVRNEIDGAALHILLMPRAGREARIRGKIPKKGAFINKGVADKELPSAIAGEIVRFLQSDARIEGQPVSPADVAVLCRTNLQAMDVQAALRNLGVPSVLQGDASVFDASEAAQLELVLRAVADPGDAGALKAALATDLLGVSGLELFALQDDERGWDRWLRRLQEWHQLWVGRGFTPAFRRLLDEQDVPARLLALPGGERHLTNLLHLGELLQRAAVEWRRGPRALVEWLGTMRRDAAARVEAVGETAQIRLESDARALKLVTIHKSKGLEYPVVFCPYLWDGTLFRKDDKEYLRFHESAEPHRPMMDLAADKDSRHCELAEREARAENQRLLYVALTRAKYRCVVVWGAVRDAEDSPLARLLDWPGPAVSDDETRAQLAALAAESGGSIATADLSFELPAPYRAAAGAADALCSRTASRVLRMDWRLSSFSRLVSGHDVGVAPADEGLDHDEGIGEGLARPPETASSAIVLSDFPRGARAGNLIHELFETLDFPTVAPAALRDSAAAALIRYGLDPVWAEPLQRALGDVLDTPLRDAERSLRLREIETARRLNEMEFIFPVAAARPEARFTSAALANAFEGHAAALPAGYPDSVRRLGFAPLAGYLRGFVDLVFEHGGRWYLVDYKSNFLGPTAADYRPERLGEAMAQHHYFLQYHLYVVALHQYLALRVAGYDYERDFAGVFYLFVRGMAPNHAPGCGVFFDRPARALIDALSDALAGAA